MSEIGSDGGSIFFHFGDVLRICFWQWQSKSVQENALKCLLLVAEKGDDLAISLARKILHASSPEVLDCARYSMTNVLDGH